MQLPEEFKGYFWDCDFIALNQEKYRSFVLGRLLQHGGAQAMKWVRGQFSAQEVKVWLDKRGQKILDSRSFVFWSKCVEMDELW